MSRANIKGASAVSAAPSQTSRWIAGRKEFLREQIAKLKADPNDERACDYAADLEVELDELQGEQFIGDAE